MNGIDRRQLLAGAVTAGFAFASPARAATADGAVALVCSGEGIGGLLFAGEAGAVLDPAWRWHIGSNTKAMTAALYARLVELGRCRWQAPVGELFPSVSCHPAWADVRVEDLLGHASGLTDTFVEGEWLDGRRADPAGPRQQRRELVSRVLASPPPEAPGVYRYGNLNYVLVGAAIEQATGSAWEEAMRRDLFAPLRMADSGFGAPPCDGPWGRVARDGGLTRVDPAGVADNPAVLWPSGGVHVSPQDYARFLSALLRHGEPVLRSDTLDRLLRPARPGLRYAGGWSLDGPAGAEAARLSHDGSNTLWFASALIERDAGEAWAAMTNRGGGEGARTVAGMIHSLRRRLPP